MEVYRFKLMATAQKKISMEEWAENEKREGGLGGLERATKADTRGEDAGAELESGDIELSVVESNPMVKAMERAKSDADRLSRQSKS